MGKPHDWCHFLETEGECRKVELRTTGDKAKSVGRQENGREDPGSEKVWSLGKTERGDLQRDASGHVLGIS